MFIRTKRLIIRGIETMDGMSFFNMASDGSLNDIGFDVDCRNWMNEWIIEARELADNDDPTADYLAYTVELEKTHEVIGSVGCSYYEDLAKVGITYFIGTTYRNKGYATEAIDAYISYYFQHYKQDEIIATVREDNSSSWRVVEKAGFTLVEIKKYQDINDESEQMYRFYSRRRL